MYTDFSIINELNLRNLSNDEWNHFLILHKEIFNEIFPNEPYDKAFEHNQFLIGFPNTKAFHWVVKIDDKFIAYAQLFYYTEGDPNYEERKNTARCFIIIAKEYRRKKIGTKLFLKLQKKAIDLHKNILYFNTTSKAGWSFIEKLGGRMVLKSTESFLELSDINWNKMKQWKLNGYEHISGIYLKNYESIPEILLDKFIELQSNVLSNVPMDDSQLIEKTSKESLKLEETLEKEKNLKRLYKIAFEKDDNLSGFTMIHINPETPDVIEQGLTGVAEKYQNRGLGRLLKSEMLYEIKENYPNVERIYTANANSNAPMLKINKEMGFKELSTWKHYEIKI